MLPHTEEPRQLDMSDLQSVRDQIVGQDASTRNAHGEYVNPEVDKDLDGTLAMLVVGLIGGCRWFNLWR